MKKIMCVNLHETEIWTFRIILLSVIIAALSCEFSFKKIKIKNMH
jgi:hypothetical protein